MFISKLATLYGVVLIAATDAFPGVIPNHARQDAPTTGDTEPIQLSSVSGGATSHTVPPTAPPDPSTATGPLPSLSAPTTANQSKVADASPTVSTPDIDTPTVTHDATGMIQTETTTGSPTRIGYLSSGGLVVTTGQ
ncbi:hypothetical protein LXA43DRAFT_1067941 [Ganoderma leucocontextum]|nr:hypothetical protein LXA43DRAFT_1067941 [Ganoderma leucocontextum]